MKILGLEFSSSRRSVAFLDTAAPGHFSVAGTDAGSTGLDGLALIETVLRDAAVTVQEVELIAVGLGPGSYTGIRAALSIAQGWQLAREVKTFGISSVDCLAAQAAGEGIAGHVHIVIDAQRDELYMAGYKIDDGAYDLVEPLRLVPLAEAQRHAAAEQILLGPDAARCGPGALEMFPDAAALVVLAAGQNVFVRAEVLEPIYLRPVNFVKAHRP